MIASLVYLLCALTSIACAFFLLKGSRMARGGLMLWSGLCFALLAISNILLFLDLVVFPEVDLLIVRTAVTASAHLILVLGLISKDS
ncbi:MAG: DUF5985 family protein [Verrucomicrobiota bacterium]